MTVSHAAPDKVAERWFNWVEPWYLVYAFLGILIAGVVPVLLPLKVSQGGNPAQVGWVMAAVSLGGLSAPVWGALTDRYRLHRAVLLVGLLLTTVGLAAFVLFNQAAIWFGLALILSIGAAGASTVANLFVVEKHPKDEWDKRIGWLQTFYGVGQVVGLALAAYFSGLDLQIGILATAGLGGVSILLGWLTTKSLASPSGRPSGSRLSRPSSRRPVLLHPARHAELTIHSPQRFYHHLSLNSFRRLDSALGSRFGVFLAVWLIALAGSAAVFSQYPLLMQQVFGIAPGVSSLGFAMMAGLGLVLYTPAGVWSDRFGSGRILRDAILIRVAAFSALFVLGVIQSGLNAWLALVCFTFIVLAWSLMSVAGTALAASLSPVGEGEGMGIFNAVNALAGVVGALLGGWVAGMWGYTAVLLVAVIGVAAGLLLSVSLVRRKSDS